MVLEREELKGIASRLRQVDTVVGGVEIIEREQVASGIYWSKDLDFLRSWVDPHELVAITVRRVDIAIGTWANGAGEGRAVEDLLAWIWDWADAHV